MIYLCILFAAVLEMFSANRKDCIAWGGEKQGTGAWID